MTEEGRRLLAAATERPWRVRITEDNRDPEVYVTGLMSVEGRDPDTVPPKFYIAFLPPMNRADSEADAALIVAAVNQYAALLDIRDAAAAFLAEHDTAYRECGADAEPLRAALAIVAVRPAALDPAWTCMFCGTWVPEGYEHGCRGDGSEGFLRPALPASRDSTPDPLE